MEQLCLTEGMALSGTQEIQRLGGYLAANVDKNDGTTTSGVHCIRT